MRLSKLFMAGIIALLVVCYGLFIPQTDNSVKGIAKHDYVPESPMMYHYLAKHDYVPESQYNSKL